MITSELDNLENSARGTLTKVESGLLCVQTAEALPACSTLRVNRTGRSRFGPTPDRACATPPAQRDRTRTGHSRRRRRSIAPCRRGRSPQSVNRAARTPGEATPRPPALRRLSTAWRAAAAVHPCGTRTPAQPPACGCQRATSSCQPATRSHRGCAPRAGHRDPDVRLPRSASGGNRPADDRAGGDRGQGGLDGMARGFVVRTEVGGQQIDDGARRSAGPEQAGT